MQKLDILDEIRYPRNSPVPRPILSVSASNKSPDALSQPSGDLLEVPALRSVGTRLLSDDSQLVWFGDRRFDT